MNFFGPIVPAICQTCPCGWGGFFQVIQNLLSVGVTLSVIFAVLLLAYAGFLFVMTPTSSGNVEKGKSAVMSAIVGLVIVLGAWLIVNTVMNALYNGNFGPWNSIISNTPAACLTFYSAPVASTGAPGVAATQGSDCPGFLICGSNNTCQADPQLDNGSGAAGQQCNATSKNCASGLICDSTGVCAADDSAKSTIPSSCTATAAAPSGGSCAVPSDSNNPCSVQSLSNSCFASSGQAASEVCDLESAGGQTGIPSGSDKLNKGQGPSYSYGLWQINLTTTQIGGLNCPSAFSHPCQGQYIHNQGGLGWCDSTVVNQDLYTQCVRAAQDPTQNTQAACSLYNSSMSAWSCSASRCSVPGANTMSGACAPGNG